MEISSVNYEFAPSVPLRFGFQTHRGSWGWYLKIADMLISNRVVCFYRIPKRETSMSAVVLYRAMRVQGYWVVDANDDQ